MHIKKLLANKKLILPIDSLVVPADKVGTADMRKVARIAAVGKVRPMRSFLTMVPARLLSWPISQTK